MHWVTLLAAISLIEFNSCRLNWNLNDGLDKEIASPLTNLTNGKDYAFLDQKLDHFDLTDKRKWKQAYLLFDAFYKPGKPVILFLTSGQLPRLINLAGGPAEMALKYESLYIILETRYFGLSQPTSNITTLNLAYLTADQILADTAHFIDFIMEENKLPLDTKWVVLGCGRGGSWASWMRMKYPHLVHGAVASSAPFLINEEYNDSYEIIRETLDGKYPNCSTVLRTGIEQLEKMLEDPQYSNEITNAFNLCKPLESKEDNNYLLRYIIEEISEFFKFNPSGEIDILGTVCGALTNPSGEPEYEKVALLVRGKQCINSDYNDNVGRLKEAISRNSNSQIFLERTILYQKCTEYGLLTTTAPNSLFGSSQTLESKLKFCSDVFGPKFDRNRLKHGLERTNRMYGGSNFRADNVLYTYFTQDPYMKTGLHRPSGKRSRIMKTKGGFHCADLFPNAYLPEEVKRVKPRISYYVGNLLRF